MQMMSGRALYENNKFESYIENNIGKDNIKEIIIQDGVEWIADFPSELNNLTKVYLPKSLRSIEDPDFGFQIRMSDGNNSLNYIEVDDDNENYYDIEGVLFKDKGLKEYPAGRQGSYKIPSDTKYIMSYAFEKCKGLTSVEIPDSVMEISADAFSYCSGLTSIEIPDSVTKIGAEAFSYCSGLTSVEIPDSVTEIGAVAFRNCTELTNVKLSSNMKKIDYGTFAYCKNLSNIEIPEGVVEIGTEENVHGPFYECTSLKKMILPDSVTFVHRATFEGCNKMKVYSRIASFDLNNREKVKSILDNQAPTIKLIKDGKKIIIEAKDNEGGIGLAEKPYSTDNINWFSDKEIILNDNQVSKIYVKDELGNVGSIDISKAVDIAELKEKEKNDQNTNDGNKENKNENDGNKESGDKNDQNSNKDLTDGKNNNNGTKDTSESPKIFGQYGGKSIAIMALIIIFGTGVVGYKKYKKNNF